MGIMVSILQVIEERLREVWWLVSDHKASKLVEAGFQSGFLVQVSTFFWQFTAAEGLVFITGGEC